MVDDNNLQKNKTGGKIKNFIFLHLILIMYSGSSIISKLASKQEFMSLEFIMLYGTVLVILFLYAILWQQVIKKMYITVAYANKAVTVIWGIIWGTLIFDENISAANIIGAIIIIAGVIIMIDEKGEEK